MTAPAFWLAAGLLAGTHLHLLWDRIAASGFALLALAIAIAGCRRWPFIAACALGFALTWYASRVALDQRLDESLSGRDQAFVGQVLDFPTPAGSLQRMLISTGQGSGLPQRLRLNLYDSELNPQPGECFEIVARLRRPRGFSNPVRFDYEAWLYVQGIGATGYVRSMAESAACPEAGPMTVKRRQVRERLQGLLPNGRARAVLLAVTLGARQWLDDVAWNGFAVTGTGHLMAISGMHVGFAFAAAFLLCRSLAAVSGWQGQQRRAAASIAMLLALAYAALSGFAVPARRASIMLFLAVASLLLRRSLDGWQLLGLAACAVLATSPTDVFSGSFRLSFIAVAVLLLMWRPPDRGAARQGCGRHVLVSILDLLRLQFTLLAGMLPLTVALFGRVAWLGPVANLLAVPWFGLVALPAALSGIALPGLAGDTLLHLAWRALAVLIGMIEGMARLPAADVRVPGGTFAVAAAIVAAVGWLILPTGWPGRRIAWLAVAAALSPPTAAPPRQCADVDVLDVGHGLAVVLRTRQRTLVYDAGPAFRSGTDTGQLVLGPFLDRLGVNRVDLFAVSHADSDHAGGVASVARRFPVSAVLGGEALPASTAAALPRVIPCVAGMRWDWDGVHFRTLAPDAAAPREGNNASCVLAVGVGPYRALLTGDVERPAERRLLQSGSLEAVDWLSVPHHGSRTSSHQAFVDRTGPRYAVVSTAFGNRWNMPHADVVERWTGVGASLYDTAIDGAVGFRLCADGGVVPRYRHRRAGMQMWNEP